MRVGIGFDLHRFTKDRKLILCGVEIPYEKGLLGHSDADVALHALTDAILGAAGLPDIGILFPDDDPRFKGAASKIFLKEALRLIGEKGLYVYQVDLVLILDQPKIAPYREAMQTNLSRWLKIPRDRVGLKAKTTEGLGFWGGEAVAAWATAVLKDGSHA
ncbi:MAG TPA: 2-C-methyl-D-erythritol 2,4-cyclodiphosphate synthase [Thermodesulfobacteriaceae bacterium]|nr:2-C-methyl-D-erythritol 2,4-cyclodiphosphate synthase [Thermodesulfobacteriaceae bacterium]